MKYSDCNGKGWFEGYYLGSCDRCGGDGNYEYYQEDFFGKVIEGRIRLGRGLVRCIDCNGIGVCSRCGGRD